MALMSESGLVDCATALPALCERKIVGRRLRVVRRHSAQVSEQRIDILIGDLGKRGIRKRGKEPISLRRNALVQSSPQVLHRPAANALLEIQISALRKPRVNKSGSGYLAAHESQCPLGLTVALNIWHCPQEDASPPNNPQFEQV
jgi:hypothetical protein